MRRSLRFLYICIDCGTCFLSGEWRIPGEVADIGIPHRTVSPTDGVSSLTMRAGTHTHVSPYHTLVVVGRWSLMMRREAGKRKQ